MEDALYIPRANERAVGGSHQLTQTRVRRSAGGAAGGQKASRMGNAKLRVREKLGADFAIIVNDFNKKKVSKNKHGCDLIIANLVSEALSQIEIRATLGVGESRISRVIKEVKAGTLGKHKENTVVPHALTNDDV